MKCTNCGTELTEGAAFCPECGSPVNNRQQEPEATAETKQETVANEPAEAVTEKVESAQAEDAAAEAATYEGTKSDAGEEVPVTEETPTETAEVPTETVPAADGEIPAIEETPKKKPLYKKPLFYIILVLILALLAGGGYFLAKEVIFRDEDDVAKAWKNTLDAEFGKNEFYNALKDFDAEKGISYEIFANLTGKLTTLPNDVSVQINGSSVKGNSNFELMFGASKDGKIDTDDETLLSLKGYSKDNTFVLGTNILGDGLYGMTVDENFVKNFENSLLGQLIPDDVSGLFSDFKINNAITDPKTAYEEFIKSIKDTKKSEKEKIELDGKTVSVTANTYTIKAADTENFFKKLFESSSFAAIGDDNFDVSSSDLTLKIFVKGKYVVRIDLEDENGGGTIIFGKNPKDGKITASFKDKDASEETKFERTVSASEDEYSVTYKASTADGNGFTLDLISESFNADEITFTHNKKDGKIKLSAKDGDTEITVDGTIKTDNGLTVEFKDIAGKGIDINVSLKNEAAAEELPEYTDILKMSESDFMKVGEDIQTALAGIIEKMPDILGDELAKMITDELSQYLPGLSGDSEYYTSGNYAYFEQSTHPNGLSQEDLQGIYEQCVSVITGGNATAGVKDYSDYLGCYVAVFEQKIGDVTYHIEKCYADDTYSEIGAYFCRVFDKNGCAIDIYLDNLKTCEGIYVYLAENANSAIILIYDGTGAFQTVYTNDEQ